MDVQVDPETPSPGDVIGEGLGEVLVLAAR